LSHDTAHIISTQIAKKKLEVGVDQGEMLIFQSFIYSWVCYECLKVLSIFGLQPTIRDDINSWSPDLHGLFSYYSDKSGNKQYLSKAAKIIGVLFEKTDHFSYFEKLTFGSKTKFDNSINPIL